MDYNNNPHIKTIVPVQGNVHVQVQNIHENVMCMRSIAFGSSKGVDMSKSSCVLYCPSQRNFPLIDYIIVYKSQNSARIIFKQVTTSTALNHIQRQKMENDAPDSSLPELEFLCNLKNWDVDIISKSFFLSFCFIFFEE